MAGPAVAQDVTAGEEIAQRWCGRCHAIGRAPAQNDVTPSFSTTADVSACILSLHDPVQSGRFCRPEGQ
jgi:hypothetical protein